MSNEVIAHEPNNVLSTALTPQTVVAQVKLIQEIMRDVMRKDEHYGAIPGVRVKEGEQPKMVLLKAGAEKLCFTFQLVPSFVIDERNLPNGHREYRVVTKLSMRNGVSVGEGVGTCSTMESKYRYRNGGRKCPHCGKEAIIKGKSEYGGGWLCFPKKQGCGAKWPDGVQEIEGQDTGKVDNPDPADQYNTCLKMAKKRSIVDATITACASSDIFTQDLDELPEYETAQPSHTSDERAKAAASPDPSDKPQHNMDAKNRATPLWEELRTMGPDGKKRAAAIKQKHGTNYEAMIPELEASLVEMVELQAEEARAVEASNT